MSNATIKRLDQVELELHHVLEDTARNVKSINSLSSGVDVSGLKENRSNIMNLLSSNMDTINLHIKGINETISGIQMISNTTTKRLGRMELKLHEHTEAMANNSKTIHGLQTEMKLHHSSNGNESNKMIEMQADIDGMNVEMKKAIEKLKFSINGMY